MGKEQGRIKQMLGKTEEGLPDTPRKMSNVKLARIVHAEEGCGCPWCFPHGKCTVHRKQRSWKNHRKTKYRPR